MSLPGMSSTDQRSCVVFAEPCTCQVRAANLAYTLALPLVTDLSLTDCTYYLHFNADYLELVERGGKARPVYVDFIAGQAAYRRRFGGGRRQPLAKAVGLKGGATLTVVDATAGLGQDAFVLANLGCIVTLVERSPLIAALLQNGLQRAARDAEIGVMVNQGMQVIVADSRHYLQSLAASQRPQVIYLDPMYPHRQKSALVKKEMRLLRELVGEDEDASELLMTALACAKQRVVVKRPRLAPFLAETAPSFQIIAPNTRFDVYLIHTH